MVLVKKLIVLYLVGNRKLTDILSGRYPEHSKPSKPALTGIHSSNKATPTPIRQRLLIVPLPMSLWGLMTFKPSHCVSQLPATVAKCLTFVK